MAQKTFTLDLQTDEFWEAFEALSSQAAQSSPQFVGLLLSLLQIPAQLSRIEQCVTAGARVTLLLKPSQLLLDLVAAMRAGDFDGFLVKHPHLAPSLPASGEAC